ncbi:MAG: hypothetical protein LBP73_04345 [Clostridiales Family XIII bacterium]|nr:hypothetical protein [Clostridiales Family XIII bacterium]
MKRPISLLCAALLLLAQAACGGKLPDISEYGDTPIEIAGLADEEFTVTPNELAELELTRASATGRTAKAGTVEATGPTLAAFLESRGAKPEDFSAVRFIASDGYRITIHERTLTGKEVILSLAPLSESERPLRLLIPGAESNQWIYAVTRIEFERGE